MKEQLTPEEVKSIRIVVDSYINSTPHLKGSREIALAHTNLQRSKMWLGKVLGEIESSPYVNSENPTNNKIEPQAEHTESSLAKRWAENAIDSHVSRVKDFRSVISETVKKYRHIIDNCVGTNEYCQVYFAQSFLALEEAKMWLGWELDRIRNEEPQPDQMG